MTVVAGLALVVAGMAIQASLRVERARRRSGWPSGARRSASCCSATACSRPARWASRRTSGSGACPTRRWRPSPSACSWPAGRPGDGRTAGWHDTRSSRSALGIVPTAALVDRRGHRSAQPRRRCALPARGGRAPRASRSRSWCCSSPSSARTGAAGTSAVTWSSSRSCSSAASCDRRGGVVPARQVQPHVVVELPRLPARRVRRHRLRDRAPRPAAPDHRPTVLSTAFADDPFDHIVEGYPEALRTLVKAVEVKDTYTHGHSERTAKVAVELGRPHGPAARPAPGDRPRRLPARPRQDRDLRRDPQQAGRPRRRRAPDHGDPPPPRLRARLGRTDPARGAPGDPAPPRAGRRRRLPRGAAGRPRSRSRPGSSRWPTCGTRSPPTAPTGPAGSRPGRWPTSTPGGAPTSTRRWSTRSSRSPPTGASSSPTEPGRGRGGVERGPDLPRGGARGRARRRLTDPAIRHLGGVRARVPLGERVRLWRECPESPSLASMAEGTETTSEHRHAVRLAVGTRDVARILDARPASWLSSFLRLAGAAGRFPPAPDRAAVVPARHRSRRTVTRSSPRSAGVRTSATISSTSFQGRFVVRANDDGSRRGPRGHRVGRARAGQRPGDRGLRRVARIGAGGRLRPPRGSR